MNKFGAILYIIVSLAMILGFPMVLWQELKQGKLTKAIRKALVRQDRKP